MADPNLFPRSSTHSRLDEQDPPHRWRSRLLRALAILLLLALIAGLGGFLWVRSVLRTSLPQVEGDIHLAGLSAPVLVRRDAHGVPHIEAATQDDLFLAQGYVTAQDRLWQMDLYRRNANGQLAQILGSRLVPHDRAQRVLGFGPAALRIYWHLDPEDRRRLDDYAHGVNLYIEQHRDALPQEFRLLMYKPEPWSGVDCVAVGTLMIDMLDSHWDAKLARDEISARLNNPKLETELYPVGSWRDRPPTGTVIDLTQPQPEPPPITDDEEDDRTQSRRGPSSQALDLAALRADLGRPACDSCAVGSNNWVVSGAHTVSGKPLLANDMHLSLTEPNIWFMADLKAPGYHAAGVTLPGLPMVVAGHNEHVAWGFTALYADVQDLFYEQLDGRGDYKALDGSWKPFRERQEVIHVRGGSDVRVNVQSTDHGPLLNPIFRHQPRPVSLQWTLFDPTLNALPLYAMNTAQNWAGFSAALGAWDWPTQNIVYADDQGHIAYHAIGRVPLRPGGLSGKPVQDTQHEWRRYIPFDSMPGVFDPPSGFLATANSRVTTDSLPYPLTLEWIDPYRVERIYKSLQGRDKLTPTDMLLTQNDIYSEVDQELAHRFAYAIDHASSADDRLRQAADLMRSWDGHLTTSSAAASLVTQTRDALWPILLQPKLGNLLADYRWGEKDFAEEEIIMHGNSEWLPPGFSTWDDVLTEGVRRALQTGHAPSDVSKWTYGSWHVMDVAHPLAAMLPVLGRYVGTGPQPMSGDATTIKQISGTVGPSQRFTMDWSNVDGSTENIVLGESSDPLSPWFRDQWNDWYNGTTFALPFSSEAVSAAAHNTLRLLP